MKLLIEVPDEIVDKVSGVLFVAQGDAFALSGNPGYAAQYREARREDAVIIATLQQAYDRALQVADIGSMDAEKAMAGFPIHKAEESCTPAWMQGHPVELD